MNIRRTMRRLPRLNLIIGKKQIIITSLTLILGIAIYVNYIYVSNNDFIGSLDKETDANSGANYGDTVFVSGGKAVELSENADSSSSSNISNEIEAYFAQARLDVQESRDEAKEFLAAMYNGGDVTNDEMEVLARDASKMSTYIESESKIENLLKAQGFDEVLCYLSDRGANIIIKTPGLETSDAAKIKSTLLSEISVAAENITIVEIN